MEFSVILFRPAEKPVDLNSGVKVLETSHPIFAYCWMRMESEYYNSLHVFYDGFAMVKQKEDLIVAGKLRAMLGLKKQACVHAHRLVFSLSLSAFSENQIFVKS